MRKNLAVIAVLLISLLLFGCVGGGQPTAQPTGTAQPTQQMQPSQEAAASEQPTASAPSGEFQVPPGGVSPDDFCSGTKINQDFAQFISSAAASAGLSATIGSGAALTNCNAEADHVIAYITTTDCSITLSISNHVNEPVSLCDSVTWEKETPVQEISGACLVENSKIPSRVLLFEKKNIDATIACSKYQITEEKLPDMIAFAKAIYNKI